MLAWAREPAGLDVEPGNGALCVNFIARGESIPWLAVLAEGLVAGLWHLHAGSLARLSADPAHRFPAFALPGTGDGVLNLGDGEGLAKTGLALPAGGDAVEEPGGLDRLQVVVPQAEGRSRGEAQVGGVLRAAGDGDEAVVAPFSSGR